MFDDIQAIYANIERVEENNTLVLNFKNSDILKENNSLKSFSSGKFYSAYITGNFSDYILNLTLVSFNAA